MKKVAVAFALLLAVPVLAQNIKLKGSDTILPIAQEEASAFNKLGKGIVSVTGGGSGVGLASLVDNTTDIAASSRKISMQEKIRLIKAGRKAKEIVIAKDALSVIVNPTNNVTKLTRQQLEDIFTGKVRNWKEVGGANKNIVVYSRESSSGTFEFFKDHVMNKKNFGSSVLSMPATGAIVQSVAQTPGAIGYIGIAYENPKVRQLSISYDGTNYVAPTRENARSGKYPVVRPLYLYYSTANESKAKPFIDFILSKEGQKIIEKVGFIAI
jgi:phosphate transport system substrate-binding protein